MNESGGQRAVTTEVSTKLEYRGGENIWKRWGIGEGGGILHLDELKNW